MHDVCAGRGRLSVAWLAVCLMVLSASASANPPPAPTGLVAAYGFEEGTQEVVLEKDRPNAITMMLTLVSGHIF